MILGPPTVTDVPLEKGFVPNFTVWSELLKIGPQPCNPEPYLAWSFPVSFAFPMPQTPKSHARKRLRKGVSFVLGLVAGIQIPKITFHSKV